MKLVFLSVLFFSVVFLNACSRGGSGEDLGEVSGHTNSFKYPLEVTVELGESLSLAPESFTNSDQTFLECSFYGTRPLGIHLDPQTCELSGSFQTIKTHTFKVEAQFQGYALRAQAKVHVLPLDEQNLIEPTNPMPLSKNYMSITLANDDHYMAVFSATHIFFLDAHNPLAPQLVASFSSGGLSQDMASTGDWIHVVSNDGRLKSFNWSDRENPVLSKNTLLGVSGQHFDVGSDLERYLFIGNTSNKKFLVVDVLDPLNPSLVFQDSLDGMGTGAAFLNGYVYATDFDGNLYTYTQSESGDWERIHKQSTLDTAVRPVALEGWLLTYEYGGKKIDLFSLEDPTNPIRITTYEATENIGMYSRPFIRSKKIYITQENPARVEWLGLNNGTLSVLGEHIFSPELMGDTGYQGIRGLINFWNNSFFGVHVRPGANDNFWMLRSHYFTED